MKSIIEDIGNLMNIKIETESKVTKKLEEFIYEIYDYKEEDNKYRLYFKDVITKQVGKSNKLYDLKDIEDLPFTNEKEIQNDK